MQKLGFLGMVIFLLMGLAFESKAAPFRGVYFDRHEIKAQDGGISAVFELKPEVMAPDSLQTENPKPVVLIEPGLIETAETLDGVAMAFFNRGYRVFIGQVRLAGRGELKNQHNFHETRNGLHEVIYFDVVEHLRFVSSRAMNQKIAYLGHSMGGLSIMAILSDPDLGVEMHSKVASVSLLTAPWEFSSLPEYVYWQAQAVLPFLKWARSKRGKHVIDIHHEFFDQTKRLKKQNSEVYKRKAAHLFEQMMVYLGTFIADQLLIDVRHTSKSALRRLWKQELSVLPLDLLIDFGQAVVTKKLVGRTANEDMVVPERIALPVQVIGAELDQLVPWSKQLELFLKLKSSVKKIVHLKKMHHVDPVISDLPQSEYLSEIIHFHDDPAVSVKEGSYLVVKPVEPKATVWQKCERFLTLESF